MFADHGKIRVYRCPCGRTHVRPLVVEPLPCSQCGPLTGDGEVADHWLLVYQMLADHGHQSAAEKLANGDPFTEAL